MTEGRTTPAPSSSWRIVAAVALVPVLAAIVNHDWLSNKIGDVDTFFYLGYFRNLGRFSGQGDALQSAAFQIYYQTRFPYILPGWLIYSIFSPNLAKVVFAAMIFVVTVASFVYAFSASMGRRVTILAIELLCCDIFFIRSLGWTYVDNGVMAYNCLTLALLTRASKPAGKRGLFVGAAGFCFLSMLMIHLGSGVLLLFTLPYAVLVLGIGRRLADYAAALLGAALAQIVLGLTNIIVWHGKFFFLVEQIAVGRREMDMQNQLRDWALSTVLQRGYWNAIEFAVWIAGVLLLALVILRRATVPRPQVIALGATVATLSVLMIGHFAVHTIFFVREGLYSAFFLPMTYLSLSILILGRHEISNRSLLGIVALFVVSLLVRLHWQGDLTSEITSVPAWVPTLMMAGGLSAMLLCRSGKIRLALVAMLPVVTLLLPWRFGRDPAIDRAYTLISTLTGSRLPRIAIDGRDRELQPVFVSIVASFTDKAWWNQELRFPIVNADSLGHPVFILSHTADPEAMKAYLSPFYDRVSITDAIDLSDQNSPLWIYKAVLDSALSAPGVPVSKDEIRLGIVAAKLPSLTGHSVGTTRQAKAPDDPAGFLTYGPDAIVAPGRYEAHITYEADSEQHFDIVAGGTVHTIASGSLPATQSGPETLAAPFEIGSGISEIKVRTTFLGSGTLHVLSVGIQRVPGSVSPE